MACCLAAGQLNRRVKLQQAQEHRDDYGAVIITWATLAEVWANRRDTSGMERLLSGATTAIADAIFTIHYRPDVITTTRVAEGAREWDVQAIAEIGLREQLQLSAKLVGA